MVKDDLASVEAMRMYSLYDRKLREFGAIALSRNDESIMRAVADGIPGTRSMVERHPEDFDIMFLGEFFPQTGFVAGSAGPPRLVSSVADVLRAVRLVPDEKEG